MTRLVRRQDLPTLAPIALATLRAAWPDAADRITMDSLRNFANNLDKTSTVVACSDAVDAFILTDREDDGRWRVVWMMPLNMPGSTGKALITWAFQREQSLRPFTPTTECYTRLEEASQVEKATRDSYAIFAQANQRQIMGVDADGNPVVRATELWLPAQRVANWTGVVI